jgi:hypothetical protein
LRITSRVIVEVGPVEASGDLRVGEVVGQAQRDLLAFLLGEPASRHRDLENRNRERALRRRQRSACDTRSRGKASG